MHLTREEAKKILEAQGFEFEDEDPDAQIWSAIFLAEERVGTIYDDEVYLAHHMPSIFDGNYQSTSKSRIEFKRDDEEKLKSAIDKLKYSLLEYEQEKRKQRLIRVKQYFKQRNEANRLVEMMESQSLKEWLA
jgi:hypothetical protein